MSKIILLLFFITLFSIAHSTSIDTLSMSKSLSFNQTLISSEQMYEAGFFTPQGAEPDKIYLGVWYYKLSDAKTVVWVANRDTPARNSSSVVLRHGSDVGGGQVVIADESLVLWVSNKSSNGVVNPVLQLLDTGNLVVREANNNNVSDYIWQSFDYPTDTLLPGQKLGWTKKTGLDRRLISWKSTTDPASGNYFFTLTRTGDPEMFVTYGTQTIYRTGPYVGQGLSGIPAMTPKTGMNFSLPNTPDEVYYMFSLVKLSIRSRLVIGEDGLLYRYTWVPESQYWNKFWYHPEVSCDKYMACGPYGVCDPSKLFDCVCPHGFNPRDSSAVSLRDGTHGCVRRTGLECGTDGFWVMGNMKLPMSGKATVDMGKGLDECREMCKKDCNCTAYASAQVVDGVWRGCVMWKGDLLDMRTFQEGGQDLYIRLAAADLSVANRKMKVKMGIGVSVVAFTIIATIAAYFAWKAKQKRSATIDQGIGNSNDSKITKKKTKKGTKKVVISVGVSVAAATTFLVAIIAASFVCKAKNNTGSTISTKDLLIHNGANDLDLLLYGFDAIVAATNNFSHENKLGEGGFGCVYKGVLKGGEEIAVKRLSKGSKQGAEEFKNEVSLIAKLQHKNLVRLLGYCVERDEKILIYEYLPNQSLDFALFNKETCLLLAWRSRFDIICGIARGLLYLHHDSRLKIIHRDLKASNVLLDNEMNPKISDFGMARIFKGDETRPINTKRVVGTYGYMSPEYVMDGVFSIKSDVFSFGVLMLEIVTGKKTRAFCTSQQALHLIGYAWKMWEEGRGAELLDPSMGDSYTLHEVLKCIQVGLLCVQAQAKDRPTMLTVVMLLSSETTSLPQPKLPGFYLGWVPDSNLKQQDESFTNNQVTNSTVDVR